MPAKTVKDLIALNASVPPDFKVRVRVSYQEGESELVAEYINVDGNMIFQSDSNRESYYGSPIDFGETEEEGPMARPIDQNPQNKPTYPYGYVSCEENSITEFQCHNAWFIGMAETAQGYGPLLYDCLIAKLNERGFGLTADRGLVSTAAGKIWAQYLTNRPDVRKEKLDFNKSTPPIEDDCYAQHEDAPAWNTWLGEPKKRKSETEEQFNIRKVKDQKLHINIRSAVQYAYFDNGITTLNELRQAGLLVESVSENFDFKELQKLYESFIRQIKR